MTLNTLQDLLVDQLRDLYSAEGQLTRAVPRLIDHVASASLRQVLGQHLEETHGQLDLLDQAFRVLGALPEGAKCRGMEGLLDEAAEMLRRGREPNVMDAAVIASVQRVEHYEMAAYGCAITYAKLLGHDGVAHLLDQALKEEARADEALTRVAEDEVNEKALLTGMTSLLEGPS